MSKVKRRPSPALIVSLIALIFAIAGTAIAAGGGKKKTGKVVGYATVKASGDVRPGALRISNSNVGLENDSAYCFRHLPFKFASAQVTIDYGHNPSSGGTTEEVSFAKGDPYNDCNSGPVQAEVATSDGATYAPEPFHIVFYK